MEDSRPSSLTCSESRTSSVLFSDDGGRRGAGAVEELTTQQKPRTRLMRMDLTLNLTARALVGQMESRPSVFVPQTESARGLEV